MSTLNNQYFGLLKGIMKQEPERNERTGAMIRALPHERIRYDFTCWGWRKHGFMMFGNRKYFPKVARAEVAWQLLGTTDASFIMKHAPKLWGKFTEDGQVQNAYGWRWNGFEGYNQIELAMDHLKHDRSNRQVHVTTWARQDLSQHKKALNIPCITGFTLSVIDGRLHMMVDIRSSDAFIGLPYDFMNYAILLQTFSEVLCIPEGLLTLNLAHVHIYETEWEYAYQSIGRWPWNKVEIESPKCGIQDIKNDPDRFVNNLGFRSLCHGMPDWDPKPEVTA